jgi:hypothetical protein
MCSISKPIQFHFWDEVVGVPKGGESVGAIPPSWMLAFDVVIWSFVICNSNKRPLLEKFLWMKNAICTNGLFCFIYHIPIVLEGSGNVV